MRKLFRKPKIGLALGGGAARGAAHIGVVKVLQEENIPIACVAGTSVGSLIGALFAAGLHWSVMAETARKIKWKDLAQLTLSPLGIARHAKLKEIIDGLIGAKRFAGLSVPFAAVAVDLVTGGEVFLKHGSVAEAVRASSSIPGIFEPTRIGGRYLVDGGLLNNVPADAARRLGADLVIAVDLSAERIGSYRPRHVLDILFRSFQIIMKNSSDAGAGADIVIAPDLEGRSLHDLKHIDELIELGEAAARAKLPALRKRARL